MAAENIICCTLTKVADVLTRLEKSGKIFTVEFIKANGEYRVMNAKFLSDHTRARYVNGGEHHHCLTVHDLTKKAFRQIPLNRVIRINANGYAYQVV